MIRLRLVEEQAGQVNRQREAIKANATGKLARLPGPVVVSEGQTLHEALDAFAAWHRDNYKTSDGKPTYHAYIAGERIKAIKRLAPNLSLQAFGLDEIEKMVATWKIGGHELVFRSPGVRAGVALGYRHPAAQGPSDRVFRARRD